MFLLLLLLLYNNIKEEKQIVSIYLIYINVQFFYLHFFLHYIEYKYVFYFFIFEMCVIENYFYCIVHVNMGAGERIVMAHLLQVSPLGPDVLDPLPDLWGTEVSLSDQGLTRSNAVAQGAIAGSHLISEGLVLAEQVEGGGKVTAAVAAGKDLLLLSDPGCLLSHVPEELPEAARVLQTLPALGGKLSQLLVGLTQQLHLLAD